MKDIFSGGFSNENGNGHGPKPGKRLGRDKIKEDKKEKFDDDDDDYDNYDHDDDDYDNCDDEDDTLLPPDPDPTIAVTRLRELESGETLPFTGGSEVVATEDGVAYVTNGAQDRIDVFDIATGNRNDTFDLSFVADYYGVQSVAVSNGVIAAAVARAGALDGAVVLFDTNGTVLNEVTVGNLPDMVTFTPDGQKVLVANEGEPVDYTTDPDGTVSIIDLSSGAANATVMTVDFTAFDGQEVALRAAGVLIEPGKSASEDLEPEYIAVTPDGSTAWVALQEANAFGVIDIASGTVTSLESFGLIDRSMVAFDASDRDDAINLQTYDHVYGMRQPDAIYAYEVEGQTYVFTANEGDARDATEARVKDLTLDPTVFPDADVLQRDENLGRQKVGTDLGDTDHDGDYDELYVYGGRGFTIYDAGGGIVFDSATQFETLIAGIRPDLFNQDDGGFDGRSDDKGVEPEAVAVGEVNGRVLAFIGLERDNGVFVYDVSTPSAPGYVTYIDSEAGGNISPETIAFVPAGDSASGKAQILVAYEGDGNTVVYDVEAAIPPGKTLIGTNKPDLLVGGEGPDTIAGGNGNDTLIGGETDQDRGDYIVGGNGSDSVDGRAGNDLLYGMNGEDTLIGGAGADTLVGQNGKDQLSGGALGDLLSGGNGRDFLNGGFGRDELRGGKGPDTFFHQSVSGHGTDWIQDFENTDELFLAVSGVTQNDFALNFAETPRSGQDGVAEAFVGLKTTGQTLFALVDGGDLSSITVRTLSGDTFDLLG